MSGAARVRCNPRRPDRSGRTSLRHLGGLELVGGHLLDGAGGQQHEAACRRGVLLVGDDRVTGTGLSLPLEWGTPEDDQLAGLSGGEGPWEHLLFSAQVTELRRDAVPL